MTPRRAIVLRHTDTDPGDIERLCAGLKVVHTIFTETGPRTSAMIAAGQVVYHAVEVVVAAYLTSVEVENDPGWQKIVTLADVITADGVVSLIP